MSNKGKFCFYDRILCQEDCCSECFIYQQLKGLLVEKLEKLEVK